MADQVPRGSLNGQGQLDSAQLEVAVMGNGSNRSVPKSRTPRGTLISGATLLAGLTIVLGWLGRDESNRVADEGLGYVFGIFGMSCMTLLLLYSVRKRVRVLRGAGRISTWFQIHMILGLVGPVAILYHCNFHLGSLNSNVALLSALVVAASGVVGRLIYTRIHHGLSDRRSTLDDARNEVERARHAISGVQPMHEVWAALEAFEKRGTRPRRNPLDGVWSFVTIGHRCRVAKRRALRSLRQIGDLAGSEVTQRELQSAVKVYVGSVRRTATIGVYERVFALWHILHLPLAFLLYTSAVVHVVAVNMY
jgi:hypothetical protein